MSGMAAKLSPIGTSTKYNDTETDLLYYNHRYYYPGTGRWLSRDSLAENGGANLYSFCKNDPVTRIDPDGSIDISADTILGWFTDYIVDPLVTWIAVESEEHYEKVDVDCPEGSSKYLLFDSVKTTSRKITAVFGWRMHSLTLDVGPFTYRTEKARRFGCCKNRGCFRFNTGSWSHPPDESNEETVGTGAVSVPWPDVWARSTVTDIIETRSRERSCVQSVEPLRTYTFYQFCRGTGWSKSCFPEEFDNW